MPSTRGSSCRSTSWCGDRTGEACDAPPEAEGDRPRERGDGQPRPGRLRHPGVGHRPFARELRAAHRKEGACLLPRDRRPPEGRGADGGRHRVSEDDRGVRPDRSVPRRTPRGPSPPRDPRHVRSVPQRALRQPEEEGYRPDGEVARRPLRAYVVVLSEQREGVRAVRLVRSPAQGLRRGRRPGPPFVRGPADRLTAPRQPMRTPVDTKQLARRLSQGAFLLLFFVLLVKTAYDGRNELSYPVKIFLDADLLIFLTSLLSAHRIPAALFLALLFVPVTLLFGRAFCGWVCPLGTLNHAVSFYDRKYAEGGGIKPGGSRWKFATLLFFAGAALFGIQTAGLLDPISLLIRSLSLSVMPGINHVLRLFLDWGYRLPWRPASDLFDGAYTFLRAHFLSFFPARYEQALFLFALFFLVLVLNRYRTRFFCRFVCPLGGLLGFFSRAGLLRLSMNEQGTRCLRR